MWGQWGGGSGDLCQSPVVDRHFYGTETAVIQHTQTHSRSFGSIALSSHTDDDKKQFPLFFFLKLFANVLWVSLFLVMLTCGGMTVMANNTGPRRKTHIQAHTPSLTHRVSDGYAIDSATEIIKCCPTGSSIRH